MGAQSARRAIVLAPVLALLVTLPLAAPVAVAGPDAGVEHGPHRGPEVAAHQSSVEGPGDWNQSTVAEGSTSVEPGRDHAEARHRVRLVTGEAVTFSRRGGQVSIESVEGGSVDVVETNDRTYLLPDDPDLSTYDRSLFAVEWLIDQQSNGGGLPVLLDANASPESMNASGLRDVRVLESAGVIAAEIDPSAAPETIPDLVADGTVERVSIDGRTDRLPAQTAVATPTTVRARNVTGEGVTVAVLDTGIDSTHPDLADRVVDRVDFVDGVADEPSDGNADSPPLDPHGHGTIVAGVLAGSGEASGDRAHAGVAPGVDLVDVRVMDERGVASASTIVEGVEYAVAADVDVILLSIGSSIDGGDAIDDSVEWATERGVIVVAAAGNGGQPRSIGAPGRPADAITVGATDAHDAVDSYSSMGPTLDGHLKPDLVAPGQGIVGPRAEGAGRLAIDDAGRYTRTSGTSVAAPQVAGAVALLLDVEPGQSAREVENRLASAARPIDGDGAYAHGSGAIDVEAALDPDVVARDAVIDFGLVETDETRNRTVTLTNQDDRRHELSLETAVRNVDLGRPADASAWLNRTELSLEPGERATIELTVDGNTSSGAHAGAVRYAVDGEPRTIAFGFVRGGRVTVVKRALTPGSRVDGDDLWVFTEEGTHDELLEFENGTADFVAGGGTYVLWSTGRDEASGTTVFLSERLTVDGPTHVVLDEGETVPVGVDVGPLEDRYGPLATRSLEVSMSTEYAGGLARRSVSRANVAGHAVRVSRDRDLDVATTFLLSAGGSGRADLDAPDVFHLANAVAGVRGPSVIEVTPDRLQTIEYRHHRTTVDERYGARDRAIVDGVWNLRTTRWFGLGDRTTQRLHRLAEAARYHRSLRGSGWVAQPGSRAGAGGSVDVLAHPMTGLVDLSYVETGRVDVEATPFADGSGTRFDPAGEHTLTATIDGEVVRAERVGGGNASLEVPAIAPGDRLTVRLVGNNSGGHLSTRTVTEVTLPGYAPPRTRRAVVEDRPPTVTSLAFVGGNEFNSVEPGTATLAVDVDLVGVVVDPTVWYSNTSPAEPPWDNRSAWIRADAVRDGDRLLATMDLDADAGRLSVAAELRDIWGRRTRTMTTDGVHVGTAPNTSTSTISGRFLAADGTPAANDTVVLRRVGRESARHVRTDRHGRYEVELPRGRRYDLVYVRGDPWAPRTPVEDDRPAWLPLERVDAAEDVDLGVRTLPAASELSVNVTDERGEPVGGASVRAVSRSGNVSGGEVLTTDVAGSARARGSETPGIDLAGAVQLVVTPPDDELYVDRAYRAAVTVDRPRTVGVTIETRPPTAVLVAFGTFEPGDVVFLHAYRSEVPAGAAEYRWDLDGDGEADRVTERPLLRYVPTEETRRPTVTVVDEAGKMDASTVTLPIESE